MNHELYPIKRIIPEKVGGKEDPKLTERKLGTMEQVLTGDLDIVTPQKRPTALDFQGLPPGSNEENFINWIKKEIEIDGQVILEDNSTERSKNLFKILNDAYQKAKIFLVDTLKYSEEEVNIGPVSISSKKDIFNLLSKTVLARQSNNGLSKAPLYCRLVKATIVAHETLKHDSELLKENTEYFENSIISSVSENSINNTPLIFLKDTKNGKSFYLANNGEIKGNISFRGKDQQKAMLKYFVRAESDAESALKDGIGSRVIIEEKKSKEFVISVCEWLLKDMGVGILQIENQSFLNESEKNILKENLLQNETIKNKFNLFDDKPNPTSMGNFKSLRIMGTLDLNGKHKKDISKHSSQFEIQLVLPDNKNESGKMNHHIYDLIKFVTARTRLDGGCPESVFNQFVKDASVLSGISEQKIISYIIETPNAPIVKLKKKNSNNQNDKSGRCVYIANSVYKRWDGFGWVDDSLMKEIGRANGNEVKIL